MGFDKATTVVDGTALAARVAAVLASETDPVVEVGPGVSGLARVTREEPPGSGPLLATVAGMQALRNLGWQGPAVVLACDLPLIGRPLVAWLVRHPTAGSVVPRVGGLPQPLCARWSAADLEAAACAAAQGERSMRPLLARPGIEWVDETSLGALASPMELNDVDEPADLDRLGLRWQPPTTIASN